MRKLLTTCLVILLFGCQPTPLPPPEELSFTRYQPIYLNVAHIEITDEYKSPMHAPYVEHLLNYSPSDAMHIWVKDRLRSVGPDKTLQVIIKDGSVIASEVPNASMMSFKNDRRYDAKLEVEMRIYGNASAMSEASVNVSATRSITIGAKASADERDRLFRRMIADMMDGINAELEKNMFTYMSGYINYSQNP